MLTTTKQSNYVTGAEKTVTPTLKSVFVTQGTTKTAVKKILVSEGSTFTEKKIFVLTQSQFDARQQAGTLVEGEYHIIGTPLVMTVTATEVAGATVAKSVNLNGTDYNFGSGIENYTVISRQEQQPSASSSDFTFHGGKLYAKTSYELIPDRTLETSDGKIFLTSNGEYFVTHS